MLRNVTLEVKAGSVVCLFGPSGSGKSTLLNIIAGLVRPDHGNVLIGERDITNDPPHRRDVGFIFQDTDALFPHMTVAENITFAVRVGGKTAHRGDLQLSLGDILERTRLQGLRHRKIENLSGGEKQRVAIARTLIVNPKVILLDEPLSSLDNALRRSMLDLIAELHGALGGSYLYVTHDEREASYLATDVAVIHDEHIVQTGPIADVFSAPATPQAAQLLADWATIEVRTEGAAGWAGQVLSLFGGQAPTSTEVGTNEVKLGYRISAARVASAKASPDAYPGDAVIDARVRRVWPWYGRWRLRAAAGGADGAQLEVETSEPVTLDARIKIVIPFTAWRLWVRGKQRARLPAQAHPSPQEQVS